MKIAFVGSTGFPIGLAEVNKQILISKALVNVGSEVTVICNKGGYLKDFAPPKTGIFEGINYKYTSFVSYNPKNKFISKFNKIIGSLNEIKYLLKYKADIILINSRFFGSILRYFIIAKITQGKSFLIINEDPDEINNANTISSQLNNRLFYQFAWEMVNGALPISEYLIERVKTANPNLPILKIPTLVDLEMFNSISRSNSEKYFLFCGAAAYFDVIKFILNSYNLINDMEYKLFLVVNGNKAEKNRIESEIRGSKKQDKIVLFNYLEYSKLITLYKNAAALLIPLRPIKRDTARFPHKIGEYTASGNPIISSNFGEMKHYFTHLKNAIIAEKYDIKEYKRWMEFVIKNPQLATKIGESGKQLCENEFDYKLFGKKIIDFFQNSK